MMAISPVTRLKMRCAPASLSLDVGTHGGDDSGDGCSYISDTFKYLTFLKDENHTKD